MGKEIMRAEGLDGVMILMQDRVVIRRPGIFNYFKYGRDATHEIPFAAISEVIFRASTSLSYGLIELVRSGRSSDESKRRVNAMRFRKRDNIAFETLKEKIFERLNEAPRRQQ